ncbi:MBL fold metallo-hydrolase [Devosia faecipullorum]|uniref:MBL fold metallo-hydrolase n=1 Tax=Devosia faecipullorum TaxID=2755039 RepID=UPI00187BA074|nr:MBL fold metallo-hydrolase [Devosia faecipullorum]MBE7732823.1 MBL fold metallo-hydrolase [Devosia faecipullorum]
MVTRRTIMAGMMGLAFAGRSASVLAQENAMADKVSTPGGDLLVHPVEHASLVLEWDGKAIYVDPVGGAGLYAGLPPASAILITHGHGDHFDLPTLEAIAGDAPLVTNRDVFEKLPETLKARTIALANGEAGHILGLPIRAIPAHNITEERRRYHPAGIGNGYVLTLGGAGIYIAGDTEPTEDMLALRDIALAFLPMNLPYTMTPDEALVAINSFRPAIVYPYHYGDSDLAPLEAGIAPGLELRLRDWYPNGR